MMNYFILRTLLSDKFILYTDFFIFQVKYKPCNLKKSMCVFIFKFRSTAQTLLLMQLQDFLLGC
jgi:hypothetical protein